MQLSTLPDNVAPDAQVFASTLCVPHTCKRVGVIRPRQLETDQLEGETDKRARHEEDAPQAMEDDTASSSAVPSSAGSLLPHVGRIGLMGPQIAMALQSKYDKSGSSWKLKDVVREMHEVEPLAKAGRAASILRQLRGRYVVPRPTELLLLQGFARALRDLGFGVALHRASAAAIRATIFLSAKSRYNQMCAKARKSGNKAVAQIPFRPNGNCHLHPHLHA